MPLALRIGLAIATLLTTLFLLGLAIFALTVPYWGLFVTCLFVAAGFGVFNYMDIKYFLNLKKVATPATTEPAATTTTTPPHE